MANIFKDVTSARKIHNKTEVNKMVQMEGEVYMQTKFGLCWSKDIIMQVKLNYIILSKSCKCSEKKFTMTNKLCFIQISSDIVHIVNAGYAIS